MAYTKKVVEKTEETKDVDVSLDVDDTATKVESTVAKSSTSKKVKKTFTDSDYVLCRSVCFGGLNVTCKSGNSYEFIDYGADCEINYRDLVALIRKGSDHIFLPRFIILDDDLLEDFPSVKRVYETMYTTADLLNILSLPKHRMITEINKLPNATKNVLCKMVATEIASGHLDSISKVRALSELFDSDFNLISELFVK